MEAIVPSSRIWYPTTAFMSKIQRVATIEAMWIAVKAIRTVPERGNQPMVKISQIEMIM